MSIPAFSDKYLSLLREFEGFSASPYLCTAGKVTIGYGTNLEAHPNHIPDVSIRARVSQKHLSGSRLLAAINAAGGMHWSREKAEAAMCDELSMVHNDLMARCPAYVALRRRGEHVRADALLDMGYNMGVGRAPSKTQRGCGLLSFTGTLPLLESGRYEEAAERLTGSLWFRQVGRRARAVCSMLMYGTYPEKIR